MSHPLSFPPGVRPVAKRWREGVFSPYQWDRDPDRYASINPGEARGYVAYSPECGFPGYLKPTKPCATDRPRAAYEKLAADLAFEVEVSVPPVQLYVRDPAPEDEEHRCCISLIIFEQVWNLRQVDHVSDPYTAWIDHALECESGIVAFDTWIGNQDRSNPKNSLLGVDPRESRNLQATFIDHANAFNMNGGWEDGGSGKVRFPSLPPRLKSAACSDRAVATAERIEGISDTLIDELVSRIPEQYMSPAHSHVVAEGLKARRSSVRPVVENRLS